MVWYFHTFIFYFVSSLNDFLNFFFVVFFFAFLYHEYNIMIYFFTHFQRKLLNHSYTAKISRAQKLQQKTLGWENYINKYILRTGLCIVKCFLTRCTWMLLNNLQFNYNTALTEVFKKINIILTTKL